MDKKIIQIVQESKSKSDICKKLGYKTNGAGFKKVNEILNSLSIDISHFDKGSKRRKYELITKKCPVCSKEFSVGKNQPKEKKTCSYACSNTFFRSGEKNPNWKNDSYRTTCFLYHNKKCVICEEEKIIDVHHYDENRKNNSPENLIPLCPTHHVYYHSRYKHLVEDKIQKYRQKFILNKKL